MGIPVALRPLVARLEVCQCPCHLGPVGALHGVPCCAPCPGCGENIATWARQHDEHCPRIRTTPTLPPMFAQP